jgi:hypothetical protein
MKLLLPLVKSLPDALVQITPAFPDNFKLKAPALWSMNGAVSSCEAPGQLNFEEWLKAKLSQKISQRMISSIRK